jgi:UDP-glucose 4-epimerase
MLTHTLAAASQPSRAVLIGARGFLGKRLAGRLAESGIPILALGSSEIDLTASNAADELAKRLQPGDAVVMLAALTPDKGRDRATLMRNLAMADAVCNAIAKAAVSHVVYISSDAVYPFTSGRVDESSPAAPADLYGVMHRTREIMISEACQTMPCAILRPTAVYGAGDTHNSYGPNRFRRQAAADGKIILGGAGEETRDHIFVDDAVRLIEGVLMHRSMGLLNLATGESINFDGLARQIAALAGRPAEVVHTERKSPVTHRHFDIVALRKAFPDFRFTALPDGLRLAQSDIG